MYGRPWYVQALDASHRLFVLGIIGGSVYIAGGLGMTLFMNRSSARVETAAQIRAHAELEQKAAEREREQSH